MKILVSGSEGFFGSHLVERLLRSGLDVTCFVQYNSLSSAGWLDDLSNTFPTIRKKLVFGDIRDLESVNRAMNGIDVCIHLAALIAIPYSYKNPRGYLETNAIGTLNVMESSLRNNVKRVIHVSTSEVYGTPKWTPISEEHPIQTQSPYSASKAAADNVAMSYYYSFGLPVVILRPFNLFGPRQSTRAVIPSIITQALKQDSISLGSTLPRREFNYVPEIAEAFLKVALSEKGVGETYNVGNGTDLSIAQVVGFILELMNKDCKIIEDRERIRPKLSEVETLQSDSTKMHKEFDWKYGLPGVEGFKQGLLQTIDWYSDSRNLSKFYSDEYGI